MMDKPFIFDKEKLWKNVLNTIKISVSPPVFNTWFLQTFLIDLRKSPGNNSRYIAEIGCRSSFVKNTIETRYHGLLQEILSKSLNSNCEIIFTTKQPPLKDSESADTIPLFEKNTKQEEDHEILNIARRVGLRPIFSFENFAVSSSNQLAYAAAVAVSKELGTAYNPLFIWGGVGVGKTHLMHAVGNSLIRKNPDIKILCCTGEQFTNDIVEGIKNKTTPLVRQKYRKLDCLLIDDIQFIAGKDTIQEEFFHTFNELVYSGFQVILTSDRPPSEISKLEERLRSRFEAGLIVDIAPPDFELRCAIVQIKAEQMKLNIPMEEVQLIAANLDSARKIEGFLTLLSSKLEVGEESEIQEIIKSLISKNINSNQNGLSQKSPSDFITAVSSYYSLQKRSLLGKSRARPVARPRQILMYLLRTELGLTFEEIGKIVGGKDHTTVMHAVDKIMNLLSKNVQIQEDISGIKNKLR